MQFLRFYVYNKIFILHYYIVLNILSNSVTMNNYLFLYSTRDFIYRVLY